MSVLAAPLCVVAVALPFLFAYTDSPISNFWPLLTSWVCIGVLLAAWAWRLHSEGVAGWRPGGAPRARWLAAGLILAAVLAGAIGLAQYAVGDVGLKPWVHASQPGQAGGNLRQRNQQATLLAMGAWALLWWVLHGPLRAGAGTAWRRSAPWLALAAVAFVAVASAATASRTGAVQWVLVLLLAVLWRNTGRGAAVRLAVVGLGVFLAAAWLLPELLWRWQGVRADALFHRFTDTSPACTSRRVLWSNMLTLIGEKPWVGWGWGELDYAHYVTLFPGERFCVLLDNAHNLPLHLAVELGLPAAVLLCCAVLGWVIWSRPWSEVRPERQLAWGVLALIGLHSMLEYPLWYGPFQLAALFALVVLAWPQGPVPQSTGASASPWPMAAVLGVGAVLVWGVCALAAWDYFRVSQLYKAHADRAAAYRDNVQSKVTGSVLFTSQLEFAQLTTTALNPANAQRLNRMARDLLHYSPEPRVIQMVIESAVMLGDDDQAAFHLKRYRLAYPDDYARWKATASDSGASTPAR